MRTLVTLLALALSPGLASALEPPWQTSVANGFEVRTAAAADSAWLPEAFGVLSRAAARIDGSKELRLCSTPVIVVHPDLESFEVTTGLPWFILAAADRTACRIDTQRVAILEQHGGLRRTLLHELHHLAQSDEWERWRAEGMAQAFAGERPTVAPLGGVTPEQLDQLLAAPADSAVYLRALATALSWVLNGR